MSIQIKSNFKYEKEGMIKFKIEDFKVVKREFNSGYEKIEKAIEEIKKIKEGKLKIISLNDFLSSIAREIETGDVYIYYDYKTNTFEYTVESKVKMNDFTHEISITYFITYYNFNAKEIVQYAPSFAKKSESEFISTIVQKFKDNIITLLDFLKNCSKELFTLLMEIIIILGLQNIPVLVK